MTVATDYRVTCSSCSLPTGERTEDRALSVVLGPCCANLPRPWGRDNDGLFTVPRGIESSSIPSADNPAPRVVEDDDPDEDHRPRCENCGSFSFMVIETVSRTYNIDTTDYDFDQPVLSIPAGYHDDCDEELDRIECRECGRSYHGEHEWS